MKILIVFVILLSLMGCNKKKANFHLEEPQTGIELKLVPVPEKETFVEMNIVPTVLRDTFYFDFDEYFLKEVEITRLVGFTNTIPEKYIVFCVGGTCPIGSEKYNYFLGADRAINGKFHMQKLITNEIVTSSRGEENLVTEDKNKYALNRRIEVYAKK